MSRYDRLEPQPVLDTMRRLEDRITARFPDRDLRNVAGELTDLVALLASGVGPHQQRLRRTRRLGRIAAAVVLVAVVVGLVVAVVQALDDSGVEHSLDWVPLVESGVNDVVFGAIALYFLWTLPERLHRGHTLKLLHRLRSLAHIIDMHQLTKDPERLRADYVATPRSPTLDLDPEQLEHYLDYCSELLSMIGKAAALVAEESQDSVVLDAVSNIEALTTGMGRKIWQKIVVLNAAR